MPENTLLILNGPGLSDLSDYDGNSYGEISLDAIRDQSSALCEELGIALDFRQTDDEDEMLRFIARDSEEFSALIINPVGYARATTVDFEMYRSAIKMIAHLKKPVIEVHIANIFQQGAEITRPLQVPEGAMGFVCGMGIGSYLLAIRSAAHRLKAGETLA